MSLRVLLLSPVAKPGGAERALASLARHLPASGFEPQAILLEHGPLEEWLVEAGCPTRVVVAGRLRQASRTLGTVAAVRRSIRHDAVAAVISNHSKGHIYGGLASLGAVTPAIWWQHGIPDRSPMELAAAVVPAAAVVCGCDAAFAAQRRITHGLRVVKIHPGIPVGGVASRHGSGARVRRALGWEANPIVGTVGRLQPGKGQEVFLRAAAIVSRYHPDTRYLIVGGAILGWEGDYPQRLERVALELGLQERVHFAGHQSDVCPWLDALDVVAQASFGESFGLALVEAMALGKPLVATTAGGPSEIVEDGVSGLLVPPGRPDAMAEAILAILDRPELASSLGRRAEERARAFSEERMAESFAALLRRILGRHRVGAR